MARIQQAETLDELQCNLKEVVEMLLEDGEPVLEAEFIGVHTHEGAQPQNRSQLISQLQQV